MREAPGLSGALCIQLPGMHMVGLRIPFLLDVALFLLGQFSEHLAQMPAQRSVQNLPATFRKKNNVVHALPFRVV